MARRRNAEPPTLLKRALEFTKRNAAYLFRNGAALTVFAVAAWQSYWHIVSLANRYQPHDPAPLLPTAYLLPFSIDGVMLVAARYTHAPTRPRRALAWGVYGLGMVGTLLANVSAAPPTLGARILSAAPAIGMIVTALMLHMAGRPVPRRNRPRTARQRQPIASTAATA